MSQILNRTIYDCVGKLKGDIMESQFVGIDNLYADRKVVLPLLLWIDLFMQLWSLQLLLLLNTNELLTPNRMMLSSYWDLY